MLGDVMHRKMFMIKERMMLKMFNQIKERKKKIAVIGLGYVGMPLAVEFAKHFDVIGFDVNSDKIGKYKAGIDVTNEVGNEALKNTSLIFTSDECLLKEASFFIVAVPTPIKDDKTPDLAPVIKASEVVARNLTKESIVVYESTVYPGVTEDVCLPILEKISGLKIIDDFGIGYSPERINPGDRVHTLTKIKKIVSGINKEYLDIISKVYGSIITAGVYPVSSIKVAEAAKVCENSQRDINIAFVNELAMAFGKMKINTNEVIDAMNTKWNALGFRPGLVGGHCIGVDPYYFIYQAEQLGYHSQIIAASRKVNEGMVEYITSQIVKEMILAGITIKGSKVAFLGVTFKENCPDTRNSKSIEIVRELKKYGINVYCCDCCANSDELEREYNLELNSMNDLMECNAIIIAVAHNEYRNLNKEQIDKIMAKENKILIDIKGIIDKNNFEDYRYWTV